MNKTLAITAVLIAVFLLGASSTQLTTRWFNDDLEGNYQYDLKEWEKDNNTNSIFVSVRPRKPMGISAMSGVGTNSQWIEFGFRSDGVVVWRKKQEKE